ncbi:MAG: NAD(P)H-dependent oxidoreductase subunit E [Burkholderiaceae bacterium]|nr:NAD(P)H-dependent oxidoreductase subunit E [Burkholderiaceae bacterium]
MQVIHFRRPIGHPKGRPIEAAARECVRALLGAGPLRRDLLIEYLHRLQDAQGSLPVSLLTALAEAMRLAPAEVYEVASFYHHFDVLADGETPPPSLTVRVCESLSCTMNGAGPLLASLREQLGDAVRVQPVPCVGHCDGAPVAVVGQRPVRGASSEAVAALVAQASASDAALPLSEDNALRRMAARQCPVPAVPGYVQARAAGAYEVLAALHAGTRSRESVFDELERAGLRGLGGAGFLTGRKWRIVAGQTGAPLLVVNADEGEPGTFKDRHYLEQDPHGFLCGVLIAAWAVKAQDCYLYLRDEYAGLRTMLEREIAALRADPPMPAESMPGLHLRRGAGAYICGEESALIESLEGKRGTPRLRPPYVAEAGLFGRPTLVNNVETLFWVPQILARGADWFAGHGRRSRVGLRSFSVSGRVRDPGVKLAPAGISVRELIDEHCGGMAEGHQLYAYLPGGASGGILPAALADLPLDFDTLQPYDCFIGSAAVIVLSQADRARDAAASMMRFFRHESCGQCTPCRVGTAKAEALLEASEWDEPLIEALSRTMIDASICGLGQAAPNPVRCVIKYFPHEIRASSAEASR